MVLPSWSFAPRAKDMRSFLEAYKDRSEPYPYLAFAILFFLSLVMFAASEILRRPKTNLTNAAGRNKIVTCQ